MDRTWVGTETSFRNVQSYPMMRNKNEFMDFIDGENFLGEKPFTVFPGQWTLTLTDNSLLKEDLQDKFDHFRKINLYVTRNNRIIPDSIKIH